MASENYPLISGHLGFIIGYGILLGIGTLLVVYGIRDFLLFMEGYTFGTRGYGVDAIRTVVATSVGWFLMLTGLMKASYLTLSESRD